jgi:hypothetical protein
MRPFLDAGFPIKDSKLRGFSHWGLRFCVWRVCLGLLQRKYDVGVSHFLEDHIVDKMELFRESWKNREGTQRFLFAAIDQSNPG